MCDLAANNLRAIDTVTDGNCGLHSFGVALAADGEHNPRLARSNKFKEFGDAKKNGLSSMIVYLRRCLVAMMNTIKESVMWEGMTFETLALTGHVHAFTSRGQASYALMVWCAT